jgi:hypothetical protein
VFGACAGSVDVGGKIFVVEVSAMIDAAHCKIEAILIESVISHLFHREIYIRLNS